VALAIEFLLLAVIISLWVTRRVWRDSRQKITVGPDPQKLRIDAALAALDRDGAVAFHDGVQAIKSVLAKVDQDPQAMTSADMLSAAESAGFDGKFMAHLRQVVTELDQLDYGGRQVHELGSESILRLRELLQNCLAEHS
jgi:hypothetical protein